VTYREFRARKRAFAQLERWTEDNVVDGVLLPTCDTGYAEVGCETPTPVQAVPRWVDIVHAVNVQGDAIECELRHMAALQRQRLLVTFDVSQEEVVDQELRDVIAIVQESLRAAETLLAAPGNGWYDASHDSKATLSSRLNARKSLTRRLQELGTKFRMAQQGVIVHLAQPNNDNKETSASSRDARRIQPWETIDNELAFLTEGAEHRALAHLDARRPGDRVMSLEQISQLEEEAALAAEREDDLRAITKSATDVSHMFRELAVLVIDQGSVLDRCVPACAPTFCLRFFFLPFSIRYLWFLMKNLTSVETC